MEQKNENEPLLIKNYSNFLVDLGLNFFFSQEHDLETQQVKIEKNLKCIQDVDRHVEKWQTRNDFQVILRNNNQSSKILLLLSEKNNFIKFDQLKKIPLHRGFPLNWWPQRQCTTAQICSHFICSCSEQPTHPTSGGGCPSHPREVRRRKAHDVEADEADVARPPFVTP